jgi:Peptidase family M50
LVGRIVVLLSLLFGAIIAIAFFVATGGAMGEPVVAPVLFAIGLLMGGIVGTAVHEIGHFLCAQAVSIPVRQVLIGSGPPTFARRIGETTFELRRNIFGGGLVVPYEALVLHKYRTVFFISGGVIADIVFVALVIGVSETAVVSTNFGVLLAAIALSRILSIIRSLTPRDVTISGYNTSTDARLILITLGGPPSGPTALGLWFARHLNKYSEGRELPVPRSPAAARVCHYYTRGRWTDEDVRRNVNAVFMRELERGGLTREEKLLVLESLSTDALVFSDPILRAHLDDWSLRALTLAPDVKTVGGTRGGALVELGRYAEAKAFLEPLIASAEEPSLDRVLSHAFLARTEHALGNFVAAKYHASEARKICDAVAPSQVIISLVEQIKAEVGAVGPTNDSQ